MTRQIALTRGLRAYRPLWEAAGVQVASLADAAAGTLENGPAWAIGPAGTMLTFDKTASPSHRINVPSALSSLAGNSITLLVRVRIDSYDQYGFHLLSTTTGSTAFWQISDDTEVFVQSVSIKPLTITTNFADGLWHTIAMVSRGAAGVEMWRDGKLLGSAAAAGTALVAGAKNFFIGDWIGSPTTSWQLDGAIAEVALFDRALPQSEIEWHSANPFALCTLARNPHLIDLSTVATTVSGPDYILPFDRKHYTVRESGMRSSHVLSERIAWKVGSTRTPWVSFSDILAPSEQLVGPPTVVEMMTTDLTIDTKVVSSQELTIDQETVATGRAVTFRASGHLVANAPYTIRITVSTDGSPSQTFVKDMIVEVEA